MGNTLPKEEGNQNINETILGERIKEILRNKTDDADIKINERIACCTGNAVPSNTLTDNDFITIKLPYVANNAETNNENVLKNEKLGLQFPNTTCNSNYDDNPNNNDNRCSEFMVNKCAKELYESGCIKIKTNSDGKKIKSWNSSNLKCFTNDGKLFYGNEDCKCINSTSGFSLNNDPGNTFAGGFNSDVDNPYGIDGNSSNHYTKYSVNMFGLPPTSQYPTFFDYACSTMATSGKSANTGVSNPFLLNSYKNSNLTICLNQINIADSDIGQANLSDIVQNNNCGTGDAVEIITKESIEAAVKKAAAEEAAAAAEAAAEEAAAAEAVAEEAAAAEAAAEEAAAAEAAAEEAAAAEAAAEEAAAAESSDNSDISGDYDTTTDEGDDTTTYDENNSNDNILFTSTQEDEQSNYLTTTYETDEPYETNATTNTTAKNAPIQEGDAPIINNVNEVDEDDEGGVTTTDALTGDNANNDDLWIIKQWWLWVLLGGLILILILILIVFFRSKFN